MPDPELLDRARRFHRETPIVECHSDIPMDIWRRRRAGESDSFCRDYADRLRTGGVNIEFITVGGDQPLTMDAIGRPDIRARELIDDAQRETATCDGVRIVRDRADLDSAVDSDEIGLVLHFEGCRPIDGRPELLAEFYELGLRSVQLTWNARNGFADGVGASGAGGLTDAGRELTAELERLRILIDVSHLAECGFWDVVELADGPIVASHANAASLCPHVRNLTDEQLRAIAESGGYVGACFFPAFIGEPRTLERLLDHVDYVVELIGTDHVGVGPDYVEFARDLMEQELTHGDSSVDYGSAFDFPDGLERVETLPTFTAGLFGRGYPDEDVRKILGGNALRVCRSLWEPTSIG